MKKVFLGVVFLGWLISNSFAYADEVQFVLKDSSPLSVQSAESVSQAIARVVAAGTYTGKNPDGADCRIFVSTNASGSGLLPSVYPQLFISDTYRAGDAFSNYGSNLIIYTPQGEDVNFSSYLFGLFASAPKAGVEETVQLGIETAREEGETNAAFVTITGKGGVPSTIQLGSAISPQGQGRRFGIGQVAAVHWDSKCIGLVKM